MKVIFKKIFSIITVLAISSFGHTKEWGLSQRVSEMNTILNSTELNQILQNKNISLTSIKYFYSSGVSAIYSLEFTGYNKKCTAAVEIAAFDFKRINAFYPPKCNVSE